MCKIDVAGPAVTATWDSPVADMAPVNFHAGERLGEQCGSPVPPTNLGTQVSALISAWKAQVTRGSILVKSRKQIIFNYPSSDEAQDHILELYNLIGLHVGHLVPA